MADVIVTASDKEYFPLLQDLVLSFNQNISNSDTDFCVLDLGLTPTQLEWLSGRIHKVRAADWDFDFDFLESTPSRFKGFTVKSFLPRYFPGYRHYIWIDADAWIQSAEAIDLLIAGASTGVMAVVPELDRSYPSSVSRAKVRTFSSIPLLHGSIRGVRTWMRTGLGRRYGRKIANETLFMPAINSGVFALRGNSPYWHEWAESYRQARIRSVVDLCDQTPLNHAIYTGRIKVSPLPAWCNWICDLALPLWDAENGAFVEPALPHHPIGIMHLLGESKRRPVKVRSLDGGVTDRTLRFSSKGA